MTYTSKSSSSSADETTHLLHHAINADTSDVENQRAIQTYRSPHKPYCLNDRIFYALNPIDGKAPIIKTADGKLQLRRIESDWIIAKALDYAAFRILSPMGSAYSFYTIAQAMELMPRSMWLLVPVLSAPVLIGFINIVDQLAKFSGLPDYNQFRSLLKKTLALIEKSVEVQTEIGGLFFTAALFNDALTNHPMASSEITRFLIPALAAASGTATSIAKWKTTTPDRMSSLLRTFTIGITDPVLLNTVLGQLLQQSPPEEQAEYIPILATALIVMLTINMGSEFFRESYPGAAKIKDFGFEMIKYVMLVFFVFTFANDMYAANNNDNVPESYFYTNIAASLALLSGILFEVGKTLFSDYEYVVEHDKQDKSASSSDEPKLESQESVSSEPSGKSSSNSGTFSSSDLVDTMFSRPRSGSLPIQGDFEPAPLSTTHSL